MPNLLLRFEVSLDDQENPWRTNGPGFHRWLPDGSRDALTVDTGDPAAELRVWFERWGYVETTGPREGYVRFSKNRQEVDPAVMERQGVLDAGPLLGMLSLRDVPQEQFDAVIQGRMEESAYEALGKRVVKRLLYPSVSRLVDIIRTTYGQFWLRRIEPWDARKESLAVYCTGVRLQWSDDGGESWHRFQPGKLVSRGVSRLVHARFQDYLTREDWSELMGLINSDFTPSLGANLLTRARYILVTGHPRHALIEAVTALDVAVSEYVRQNTGRREAMAKPIEAFWTLPLPTRMALLALNQPDISDGDLELTLKAIKCRNDVVHEGKETPDDIDRLLDAASRVVAALLPGPLSRLPPLPFSSNWLLTPEQWEAKP